MSKWKTVRIGDICEVVTGGTPSTSKKEYWENGTIPWLPSGACQNSIIDKADSFITQDGLDNSAAKMMPVNTVVIALTGATTGKVGILKIDACANQSVTGILPNELVYYRFLFYFLLNSRPKIMNESYGGAQKHISQGYVKDFRIPLPPLSTQKQIAANLDKATQTIDLCNAILEKLDLLVKARFVEMFGNNMYPTVKTSDVCDFITKGTTPPANEIFKDYSEDRVPYLKVYNLSFIGDLLFNQEPQYISKSTHNGKLSRSKVYPNDVLMNIVGPPLGKFSVVTNEYPEWNVNQAIAIFRAKDKITPQYLMSALMQPDVLRPFLEQAVGIRQLNLSLEQCRNLEIPLPPLDLQEQFAAFVEKNNRTKAAVKQVLAKAETLKKALMQEYFG